MSPVAAASKTIRAGFAVVEPSTGAMTRILEFALNPETLTRSLEPGQSDHTAVEPIEFIRFTLTLDATVALASRAPQAAASGILPFLSAMELLMYSGTTAPPLVIFVWGSKRVAPVRVVAMVVDEQLFDANLNPLRAQVSVTLRALKTADLPANSRGRALWDVHRKVLQQLAASAPNGTLADLGLAPV